MSFWKRAALSLPAAVLAGLGMGAPAAAEDHVPPAEIRSDTRWTISGSPYLLPCYGSLVIAAGATLSIDAGVTVALPSRKQCGNSPGLIVEGALEAGSAGAPVVFAELEGDAPTGGTDYKSAIEFRPGSKGTVVINARFGAIMYDTQTDIAVDSEGSPIELQFGNTRARVSAAARTSAPEPAAVRVPVSRGLRDLETFRPAGAPPPFWFPADTLTGEAGVGIAPAHNEMDLNRCHSGPANCNAYATYRLRTNFTLHPFGRGPLSRFFPFVEADTFFGNDHPGLSYSWNASPTMIEHKIGMRVALPGGFWVEAVTHQNHWFGRYTGILGPADLGPNGPFGQYSLFSVSHKYEWSPRLWLAGLNR